MKITRLLNWPDLEKPRNAVEWHRLAASFIRGAHRLDDVEREMLARLVERGPQPKPGAPGRSSVEKAWLRTLTVGTRNPVARLASMLRIEREAAKKLHRQLRQPINHRADQELYDRLYAEAHAALVARKAGEKMRGD